MAKNLILLINFLNWLIVASAGNGMEKIMAFLTSGLAALHSVGLAVVRFQQHWYNVPDAAST